MRFQSFRHSDYTMEETGGKEEINLPFLAVPGSY